MGVCLLVVSGSPFPSCWNASYHRHRNVPSTSIAQVCSQPAITIALIFIHVTCTGVCLSMVSAFPFPSACRLSNHRHRIVPSILLAQLCDWKVIIHPASTYLTHVKLTTCTGVSLFAVHASPSQSCCQASFHRHRTVPSHLTAQLWTHDTEMFVISESPVTICGVCLSVVAQSPSPSWKLASSHRHRTVPLSFRAQLWFTHKLICCTPVRFATWTGVCLLVISIFPLPNACCASLHRHRTVSSVFSAHVWKPHPSTIETSLNQVTSTGSYLSTVSLSPFPSCCCVSFHRHRTIQVEVTAQTWSPHAPILCKSVRPVTCCGVCWSLVPASPSPSCCLSSLHRHRAVPSVAMAHVWKFHIATVFTMINSHIPCPSPSLSG